MRHDQTQEHEFECFYTMSINKKHLRKKDMGQSLFKKYSQFQNFIEIFYCDMVRIKSGTRIWMFLYNVSIQEPFQERNVWDRGSLRNIQNSKTLMKYFTVA